MPSAVHSAGGIFYAFFIFYRFIIHRENDKIIYNT